MCRAFWIICQVVSLLSYTAVRFFCSLTPQRIKAVYLYGHTRWIGHGQLAPRAVRRLGWNVQFVPGGMLHVDYLRTIVHTQNTTFVVSA